MPQARNIEENTQENDLSCAWQACLVRFLIPISLTPLSIVILQTPTFLKITLFQRFSSCGTFFNCCCHRTRPNKEVVFKMYNVCFLSSEIFLFQMLYHANFCTPIYIGKCHFIKPFVTKPFR